MAGLIFLWMQPGGAPPPPPVTGITSARSGLWSDPGTWVGGVVPTATDDVVIADTHTVTLDGVYTVVNLSIASSAILLSSTVVSPASITATNTTRGFPVLTAEAIAAAVRAELASELAKMAALTFTVSGQVDANVQSMNDAEVIGTGTTGDAWRGVGVVP
jgi:hypothetical protein